MSDTTQNTQPTQPSANGNGKPQGVQPAFAKLFGQSKGKAGGESAGAHPEFSKLLGTKPPTEDECWAEEVERSAAMDALARKMGIAVGGDCGPPHKLKPDGSLDEPDADGAGDGDNGPAPEPPAPNGQPEHYARKPVAKGENYYHGPNAPGPGWTIVKTGPQGGRIWAPPKHEAAPVEAPKPPSIKRAILNHLEIGEDNDTKGLHKALAQHPPEHISKAVAELAASGHVNVHQARGGEKYYPSGKVWEEEAEKTTLGYEEFAAQYRAAFKEMNKYTADEVGSSLFAERMAKLADSVPPEWVERVEAGSDKAPDKTTAEHLKDILTLTPEQEAAHAKDLEKYRDRVAKEGEWESGNLSVHQQKVLDHLVESGVLTKRPGRQDEMTANGLPTVYEPKEQDHGDNKLESPSGSDQGQRDLRPGKLGADAGTATGPLLPQPGAGAEGSGGVRGLRDSPGGDGLGGLRPTGLGGDAAPRSPGIDAGRTLEKPAGTGAVTGARVLVRGEPYIQDASGEWHNEAKPEYHMSDAGLARLKAKGDVKEFPTADNPVDVAAGNFHYGPERDFATGGLKTKYKNNLEAIKTVKAIQMEGRTAATPEEQAVMAKFVGWGQFVGLMNDLGQEKEWKSERDLLKSIMTPAEWASAKESINNAHFTDPSVVAAHWKLAERLGFKGDSFLETSAGIGYYLGMMPNHLRQKSAVSAVEKDELSGAMLKLLYPADNVQVQPFENHAAPDNHYGLVASNVPFGGWHIFDKNDPRYNKFDPVIHDYFFLKSANLAREGGLIMHVTSTGTMDKLDPDIRAELAKTCDFVGAIRFPEGTHKEGAGTDVVTDMIVLRKRPKGESPVDPKVTPPEAMPPLVPPAGATEAEVEKWVSPASKRTHFTGITTDSLGRLYHWVDGVRVPGPDWTQTVQVPDPDGGEPLVVNKYFADHPEQMLGNLDRSGTMRGLGQKNVGRFGEDIVDDIRAKMKEDGRKYGQETPEEQAAIDSARTQGAIDYQAALDAAIARMPEGVMKPRVVSQTAFQPEKLPAPGDVKEGGWHIQDGKLYLRQGGGIVEQTGVSAKQLELMQDMMGVRDAMRACVNEQSCGRNADAARAELGRIYDAFVAKNGLLNDKKNVKAWGKDPDSYNLLALEVLDSKTGTVTKNAMFRIDVVGNVPRVEHAGDVVEALGVSLHETSKVDIGRLAELTGKTGAEVGKELVDQGLAFEDPSEGWQRSEIYLSGNVRRKLVMARTAAASDGRFQPNVAAIEKVQPADIEHEQIDVKPGAPWIPPSDIAEFAGHLLKTTADNFQIGYVPTTGAWEVHYTKEGEKYVKGGHLAKQVWATPDRDFADLLEAALNNKAVVVNGGVDERINEDGEKEYVEAVRLVQRDDGSVERKLIPNIRASADANAKVQEIKDAFCKPIDEGGGGWLWEDDARRERLHRHYNDNFNNTVDTHYDGSHQRFPGMNPSIKLEKHQSDFVWQVVTTGNGLAGHEVGTGKTFSLIAAAMELRRLGLARKPCIACLKSNVEAITHDALLLYPAAKIISTADMFDAKKRKSTIAKIAAGDYDLVIMTHDNLNMMKMKPETEAKYINEEIAELVAATARSERDDPSKDNRVAKQLNDAIQKLRAKLDKALSGRKDETLTFEEAGIDTLLVDEAHLFKTLPVTTSQARIKGVPTGRSQRATTMFMRTRWLQEQHNGRGVVFATGTPVANTMAELFTMQRYLQYNDLKERGLQSFDAWANVFGDVRTQSEYTATGQIKQVSRFNRFVNIPELMQIARKTLDVQRAEDLRKPDPDPQRAAAGETVPAIVRPKRHDHAIAAPETEAMRGLMANLVERATAIAAHHGKPEKGDDNMLVVCTDGRKGAIDMRLLDATLPDDPQSKTNLMIANVLKLHKDHPGTTQVIFSDVGVHPSVKSKRAKTTKDKEGAEGGAEGAFDEENDDDLVAADETDDQAEIKAAAAGDLRFHLYQDIIDKLVKGGIPRDKIADFSVLKGKKKEEAAAALNTGEMLIGIGSTQKLGTGVNVQKHLKAVHHLDVPWVPAYIEQRNGRAWRQKNDNTDIDIHSYVSEGSADAFFWQVVGGKAKFIAQIMKGSGSAVPRTVADEDTEEITPEKLSAIATGDPRALQKVDLEAEVSKLRAAEGRHIREQAKYKTAIDKGKPEVAALRHHAQEVEEVANHIAADTAAHPEFSVMLGGKVFTDRKEAGAELEQLAAKAESSYREHEADVEAARVDWRKRKPYSRFYPPEEPEFNPKVGVYRGMELTMSRRGQNFGLIAPNSLEIPFAGSAGSLSAQTSVNRLKGMAAEQRAKADKAERDLADIAKKLGAPFAQGEQLKEKTTRLNELQEALEGEGKGSRLTPKWTMHFGAKGVPKKVMDDLFKRYKAARKDRRLLSDAQDAFNGVMDQYGLSRDMRQEVISNLREEAAQQEAEENIKGEDVYDEDEVSVLERLAAGDKYAHRALAKDRKEGTLPAKYARPGRALPMPARNGMQPAFAALFGGKVNESGPTWVDIGDLPL